jgi:UDP-glucose 4-epimerase
MRTVVTGGAGFIGSHLAEYLLREGHEVVVLDDMSTGTQDNLRGLRENPRLRVVTASICDTETVRSCVTGADAVFHLAAAVGTFTIRDDPLEGIHTNVYGSETVIAAAHEVGARILVASTSEIYGLNTTVGLAESTERVLGSPQSSRWSYSEAKALDELVTTHYVTTRGLRGVIVRLFNTVGPRQSGRYGMVIPRFVAQALAHEPVTVFGTGAQIRCFCHVADVVPALAAVLADDAANGEVFNLGGGEQVSIEALAKRVIAATGSRSEITFIPYEQAQYPGFEDVERRVPDCTKLREQIGFAPSRDLETIIGDIVEDQRARRQAPARGA